MGLSEVDSISGERPDAFLDLIKMMDELGYAYCQRDEPGGLSASALFWKKDKFKLIK